MAIFDWDSALLTHANLAAERLFGRTEKELCDRLASELVPASCGPVVDIMSECVRRSGAYFGPVALTTDSEHLARRWADIHVLGQAGSRYSLNIYRPLPKPPPRTGRPVVLIAEDHPTVRRTLCRLLGRAYDVRVAADGYEAVASLVTDPSIEVVVTDLDMPRVSGLQVIDAVRGVRPDLSERIIVHTGRPHLVASGAGVLVLGKPVLGPVLIDAVERLVG